MKEKKDYPPNIDKIRARFKLPLGTVFTYGDTIYNPSGGYVDRALEIHEQTHMKQQGNDVDGWWKRYLVDDEFRFLQEVEAYRNQYKKMQNNIKNREKLRQRLEDIARDLSSEMYGNICTFEEALEKITNCP